MSQNTYVALDTKVLSSATASVTFTSIPQGYTDLILVANGSDSTVLYMQVGNGSVDTGSNYSRTQLLGDGSSATSGRASNVTKAYLALSGGSGSNETLITHLMNYSNATTYKTFLTRGNTLSNYVSAIASLWRSTSAINTITITGDGANIPAGSTFTLYGVAAASVGAKATGGIISQDANYYYHTFLASGTFTPLQSLTADYVVVAGGGGGANPYINSSTIGGGGGGAGGYRTTVGTSGGGGSAETPLSLTATNYTVTIGAGGAGNSGSDQGGTGSNSVFSTITSNGGGGGGRQSRNGGAGGSGGGASCSDTTGGAGTTNQGYAGSNGQVGGAFSSGAGGGGAAAAGSVQPSTTAGGAGGAGLLSTITGTYLAGGGGGGAQTTIGAGGIGGGGNGSTSTTGNAGVANTGGGAGGIYGNATGANGGSGIVVIRYAK